MWNWLGMPAVQNAILFLALAVSVVTLVFLIRYVKATKGIEREAGKQSEGLSKPVVALRCGVPSPPPSPLDAASGVFGEVKGGPVELINIGNGPAIKLKWVLTVRQGKDGGSPGTLEGFLPYLEAKQVTAIGRTMFLLRNGTSTSLACSYEGLSGAIYTSTTQLEGTKVREFHLEMTHGGDND